MPDLDHNWITGYKILPTLRTRANFGIVHDRMLTDLHVNTAVDKGKWWGYVDLVEASSARGSRRFDPKVIQVIESVQFREIHYKGATYSRVTHHKRPHAYAYVQRKVVPKGHLSATICNAFLMEMLVTKAKFKHRHFLDDNNDESSQRNTACCKRKEHTDLLWNSDILA
ncbi:hypothetical protein CPB84DRAFT_1746081 [Gymnopilus junonius]|uniref:Uncharacterized protein n=1 Tax=Gymnopilus junonius TaxID=109634 RepID=A0A9P5TF57_GYMJU|nr:hypothetical protein CPB84DRAFT_1753388 [Gymnopilus junonius]KAF8903684.1 hypothetical protein CPB84DRAFT_1746081 [Gymnopilus junonius]